MLNHQSIVVTTIAFFSFCYRTESFFVSERKPFSIFIRVN